ncbi:MAG: endopeptidase La [Sulfurovaceae bacterium]|nr:endopeptidase La [Sulfurovaceae bacterium]MDD5548491.1 endopeptidase La [Sulfurovaceae bacterium]
MHLSDYDSFPAVLPIVVEDEIFLYPFMISPIFLTSQNDIDAATYAIENHSLVLVVSSKSEHEGSRKKEDLYEYGVIGSIMRKVQLPDGRVKVLFQGLSKGKIVDFIEGDFNSAMVSVVENLPFEQLKIDALMNILRDKSKTLSSLNSGFPVDIIRAIEDNSEPYRVCDLVASMIKLDKDVAYQLYIEDNVEQKLISLIDIINSQIESAKVQKEIRSKVNTKIEQSNKEYFLKEQLKQIQKELGVDVQREEEIANFRKKADAIKSYVYEDTFKEITKQIDKLSRMHPESADANTIQSYLEVVFEIPFGKTAKKKIDIKDVSSELNKDHYSLEKPKDRIVEYFAVKSLANQRKVANKETSSAILCFAGPPGVGKTSLANSIAIALHRPLVRIALGGLEDVNELRGHRRTYVGAMPGRITQGFIEAKKMDPVIVLDEIDKVGRTSRGDPTAVLLEILDPEQNSNFRDYYLNFNIDLSKAIFIATANDVSKIPGPLRDRMEFITLSSYTPKEKFEIAKRYLIPQELKKHALKSGEVTINENALKAIIEEYTREAGVRNLRKKIAGIMRKSARILLEKQNKKRVIVTIKNLEDFVDKKVFEIATVDSKPRVGVVNGLAWTAVGGDVLTIEAIKIKGKGLLQLTGSLGDVMKESAHIAFSVVKILIDQKRLKIKTDDKNGDENKDISEIYKKYDLHLHVPEGATPKDGPSAGIAMVTVISSILSGRGIDSKVAMTGEVTLTGLVLPIGGLKEKLIAAYKAGVKKALIPKKNFERDLDEIPAEVKNNIEIIPVENVDEVISIALV